MKRMAPGQTAICLGMSAALALLLLYAASVIPSPAVSAVCLFFASVMTWIPLREEQGFLWGAIEFAAVSLIALLITRGNVFSWLYLGMFGHYAIIRYFLRTRIGDRLLTVLIRFIILNALAALGLVLLQYVLHEDLTRILPNLSVFWLIALLELIFAVYMALFKVFSLLFDSLLRNVLFPRR